MSRSLRRVSGPMSCSPRRTLSSAEARTHFDGTQCNSFKSQVVIAESCGKRWISAGVSTFVGRVLMLATFAEAWVTEHDYVKDLDGKMSETFSNATHQALTD
jgi:hypothetical protein